MCVRTPVRSAEHKGQVWRGRPAGDGGMAGIWMDGGWCGEGRRRVGRSRRRDDGGEGNKLVEMLMAER